jgi:hypothetical protein
MEDFTSLPCGVTSPPATLVPPISIPTMTLRMCASLPNFGFDAGSLAAIA